MAAQGDLNEREPFNPKTTMLAAWYAEREAGGRLMSDRGFEFAHAWIAEHADPTVYQEDGDSGEARKWRKTS